MPDIVKARALSPFLVGWCLFAIASLAIIFSFGKAESHLIIISKNSSFSEEFFKIITRLGEGWLLIMALIWVFWKKRSFFFPFLVAWALSVGAVQVIKKGVLPDEPRPASVLADSPDWKPIPGVQYRYAQSFPSGHTADAFAVCFALAFILHSARASVLLLLLALSVGLSRVFLSQHFLQDVVAGSFLAIVCTWAVFVFFGAMKKAKGQRKRPWNKKGRSSEQPFT